MPLNCGKVLFLARWRTLELVSWTFFIKSTLSMKLKSAIIDDNILFVEGFEWLLREEFSDKIEVVFTCTNPLEAFGQITRLKPDLLFLDLHMPGMDGFELLKQFPKIDFGVIFVTNQLENYVENLIAYALPLLTKPVNPTLLRIELEKLTNKEVAYPIHEVLTNAFSVFPQLIFGWVKTRDRWVKIKFSEALYFKIENKVTEYKSDHERFFVLENISQLEERFASAGFYRIRSNTLINTARIKTYHIGAQEVEMDDGTRFRISDANLDDFLRYMGW
jgi:two-component system, LytTR family, response regulator